MAEHHRRYIYGIATAALAVIAGYGILTAEQAMLWAGFAGAVTGLAYVNTRGGDSDAGL